MFSQLKWLDAAIYYLIDLSSTWYFFWYKTDLSSRIVYEFSCIQKNWFFVQSKEFKILKFGINQHMIIMHVEEGKENF